MSSIALFFIIASILCAITGVVIISIRISRLIRKNRAREDEIKAMSIAEIRKIKEEADEPPKQA